LATTPEKHFLAIDHLYKR